MRKAILGSILAAISISGSAFGQLQKGDNVAVIGDSITEQRKYSVYIEEYLTMCQPAAQLRQTQFGWSGETTWGFEARMDNDALRFKPTVATTNFGMNDGGYAKLSDECAKHYREAYTKIIEKLKQSGCRFIVVGSPGCVDVRTYHNKNHDQAVEYNQTLADLRDIAKDVAQKEGVAFADLYDTMHDVMEKAEAKLGDDYYLCGKDGIHPDSNGHLVMAYAYLKALGCKGDIGTITVDMSANKAEATDGQTVLSCKDGSVEVESTRYPFCIVSGGRAPSDNARAILPFFPFNDDLNRYMLVVKNIGADSAKITWGQSTKQFSSEQLAKGINLAAEFTRNPFSEPFRKMEEQIQRKQEIETPLVKRTINEIPAVSKATPAAAEALEKAATAGVEMDKHLGEAVTASVVPVRHTIKIEAVK